MLSHLDIGNQKFGKIAFTKALGLTTEYDRRFLKELSALRNTLVHKVSNVGFNFHEYIESLDSNKKKLFVKAFGYNYWQEGENIEITEPDKKIVLNNPKESIWYGLRLFIAIVSMNIDKHKLKLQTKELEPKVLRHNLERERMKNKSIKALAGKRNQFLKKGLS